jgi:hypothetical protein
MLGPDRLEALRTTSEEVIAAIEDHRHAEWPLEGKES